MLDLPWESGQALAVPWVAFLQAREPRFGAPGPNRVRCNLAGGCLLGQLARQFVKPVAGQAITTMGPEPGPARFWRSSRASPGVARWQEPGWAREPSPKIQGGGGEERERKGNVTDTVLSGKPKLSFLKISFLSFTQSY